MSASGFNEFPYFFEVDGSARFAVLHRPQIEARGRFLFCHPLFEEKLWAHRVYVSFARRLAQIGYSVLRMDLRGTGDSDGEFGEASLDDYLMDLEAGWCELCDQSSGDGIQGTFGLRLGGTMAIALAHRIEEVNTSLTWEPVLDTSRYLHGLLRSNLSGQMAAHGKVITPREALITKMRQGEPIDIEGYNLTAKLFDSLDNFLVVGTRGYSHVPSHALVVQICKSLSQPVREEYKAWAQKSPEWLTLTVVEEPFWREIKTFYGSAPNLENASVEWMEELT